MTLQTSLDDFRAGIIKVNDYIAMAYQKDEAGNNIFDDKKIEFIVDSAFLKMFIYWEGFLEGVFIKYLTGANSTNGSVVNRHANPLDEKHAHSILIGTQKYVDWANHEIVKRLAKLYLVDGEPLSTSLDSLATILSDLKAVRNSAAHVSSSTKIQLSAVANRVLNKNLTDVTVAGFIMEMHPADPTKTVLQYYQNMLDIAAENISGNII
ncbi:hypothetical protein [Pseudomonas sp. EL_65y_Pfl1_R32]|uniref:hypothetical protein n=1 Tax=Pseudomonas sp. EL_65y_Pfl1_R32 TaxID=3088696 RepID=UPI0030D92BC2